MVNERTPLRKGAGPPPYVFMTNPNKVYRKQVRQFQCCICMALLASFLSALVLAFLYSVQNDTIDNTIVESPTDNTSINALLSMSFPLPESRPPAWNMTLISLEDLTSAISEGKTSLNERDKIEMMNPGIMVSSPSYRHQQSIKTSERARNLARSAYVMDVATKAIVRKHEILKKKPLGHGPVLNSNWLPEEECGRGPLPTCPLSSYRTVDGSCNNPYKPNEWGVAMRPYRRQLPAEYADGVSSPRVASDGKSLPSARDVSTTVHRPTYKDDPKFTVMLAVWGQFIDHDITATASTIGAGGKALSCCNTTIMHPDCYPVTLSENDDYYKQYGVTCMEFIRSAPAPRCALGPREQMNQVSSYLDGSVVYGNTPELSQALRTFQNGKLKMSFSPDGRELLPISTNPKDGCNREEENAQGRYCFMAGDARSNENLHITSLHLLLSRQHNLNALKLASLNPEWSDEQIYQETRKIVSAQMQHITYNEFLPVILGPELMDKLELSPKQSGYYNGYNASVDPTISNNFATSSFRFGHTLLPGLMKLLDNDKLSEEYIEFHKMLFNPFSLYKPGYLDMVLQGTINTNTERADAYFNKEVTQHLFKNSEEKTKQETPKYGLDLVSLNVQRGRDHGLPSYPIWREHCGLSRPKSFEDLDGCLDKDSLEKMKAIYKSVDDIDMYTGALSEVPIAGGLLGPTVTCLISDQFKRLKDGDSFFYETPQKPQGFTLDQLHEIRKTSLAKIICDTSDDITTVQPRVMETVGPGNDRLLCSDMPGMDLTKWMSTDSSSKFSTPNTKIIAKVTSGNIVTNKGDIIWNGTIPVEIPLHLLDSVTPGKVAIFQDRLLEYDHAIQWSGSMTVENETFTVKGIFSIPMYTHETPTGNISVSWFNTEFKFNSQLVWSSSDINSVDLSGSYSSPVFLSEIKNNSLKISNKEFVKVGAGEDAPFVLGDETLPIILKGVYSADRKMFLWTGKVIISAPNSNKVVPNDIKKLSTSLDFDEIKVKEEKRGGFSIIGGNIKISKSDGSTAILWNGDGLLEIPLPEFYNFVPSNNKEKSMVYHNGVVWSASVSKLTLDGDFTIPQFYHGFDNFSITWTQGKFSFNVLPKWNTTVDEILIPGVKYISKIVLHDGQLTSSVSTDMGYRLNAGSLESFVESSQEIIDGMIPVLLILFGSFTPEKFYWSGDAIIAAKTSKDKIEQQMAKLNSGELGSGSWAADKFGGVVDKGYVTAGLDSDDSKAIWSGNLPVSIPIPEIYSPVSFYYTPGVIWSASLKGSTLEGTYTIQQTMWNNSIPTVRKWSGEFSFQINPLWNTSLENLFVPGAKYYSKLNFQGVNDVSFTPINVKGIPNYNSELYAPIILQGTYSLDKKAFLWSGHFIISFKNGLSKTYSVTYPELKKPMYIPKTNTFSLTITSGSIVASPKGETGMKVWSGSLPTVIPLNLLTASNNVGKVTIADVVWSGKVTNDTIEGQFTAPTYVENDFEELQWWAGNFSFKYTSKNSAEIVKLISSGKKYNFKVVFTRTDSLNSNPEKQFSKLQSTVNLAMEAQDILENAVPGKLVLLGDFYNKPFYCSILPFCSDKNEFYWSGDAFVSISPNNIQLSTNNLNSALQFGGKVVSGSIIGGSENSSPRDWWSGVLPITIPTSIFYSPGVTPVSGASTHHGLIWSGTMFANTVTGTFSLPQYVWNGISKNIRWWNGQFNFKIQSLWNGTLDGLVLPGVKYYSEIHFQGMKEHIMKSEVFTKPEPFGENNMDLMVAAPVILQGTYTPDGTYFIWNGDFIISFKNRYSEFTTLKSSLEQLQSVKKSSDSSTGKSKPSKKSVSFKLTGGNVFGAKENETVMNIWSWKDAPIRLNIDLINKPGGYADSADITWKADQVTPVLSGQFAIPTYIKNDSSIITEMFYGNFSITSVTNYGATFEETVKPGNTYSCRVFFNGRFKMSPMYDNTYKTLQGNDSKTDDIAREPCNLILLGSYVAPPIYCGLLPFLCTDKKLFDWSGEGFLSFPVPKSPTINKTEKVPSTNLKIGDTSNMLSLRTPIYATVLSGNLIGSRESEYPRILWSGNLPAEIPLPVFWTTDAINVPDDPQVYGHGVIWSGSQLGMFFEGYFSLPQYAWNGISSSVQWWNGRFSFLLQPSLNSNIDQLIMPGVKYNSRIVFQDSIYLKNLQTSPSQDDINYALHAPIVLQGHYSPDRKIFYWDGKVVLEFHTRPNPFYPKLFTTNALNFMEESNTDSTRVKQNIGIVFTSINILSGEKKALKFPLVIPLKNISNKTTGSHIAKINWIATTVTDTQLSGNLTLPTYIPAGNNTIVENFSVSFSSNIITLFNTSLASIQQGIQYSSVVVFKNSNNVNSNNFHEESNKSNKSIIIILIGSLSPDEMFFTWTGQAWINFPFIMSNNNKLTFKLGEKLKSNMPIDSSGVKRFTEPFLNDNMRLLEKNGENYLLPTVEKGIKTSVGFVVSSGNITTTVDDNIKSLPLGNTPIIIPVHLIANNPEHVVNIEWTVTEVSSHLSGTFSLPLNKPDQNVTIAWISGKFSFEVTTLWATTLDVIQPGVKYSTVLLFQDKSKPQALSTNGSLTNLIMDSDKNDGFQSGIISLKGTFTPDMMYFNWTGETWLHFEQNSQSISRIKSALYNENTECDKYGGAVVAGRVTGNSFEGPQTYWSGILPAALSVFTFYPPFKAPHGILWSASGTDSLLRGKYYFPKPVSSDVVWLTGNFEFQVRPLWNCNITDLIRPGTKYYSKINFQGFSSLSANQKALWTGEDFDKAQNLSITLQGFFSEDRSTFFWSGNFIVHFFDH